ncbi:hypothetical protein AWB76_00937 [Caballeronia temeraria]|uniref:Uncharacterized protein n=1 Tax=Caballeronia temeraria TaxID=1777137 RepID=A0A157ZM19_9BURK|nr:hypothetical protein [Caballeronia temeraria]SAK46572.1 hypothetical protein AWB76_00937 [Caballeronia temeraria]
MSPENNSPTSEPIGSATQESQGGNVGGALSENDFIRYFNEKHGAAKTEAPVEKATETAETNADLDADIVDISESDDEATEADTAELDSDSNDTNESEPDETDVDPELTIQVDGKEEKVKQSELIKRAQKATSADKKFQAASEMRKEAEEIKSTYTRDRDTLKSLAAQYQNFIEQAYKIEPPTMELLDTNPAEYIRQEKMFQAKQQEIYQAKLLQEQIRSQEETERKMASEKHLKEQQRIVFEKFPQWKNPEKAQHDAKRIESFLDATGFSKDEQAGLNDARMLEVVHKAALYDAAMKAKDQKKAKPTTGKTLTSGVSQAADPLFQKRQAQTQNARQTKALQDNFKREQSEDAFIEMFKNKMRTR